MLPIESEFYHSGLAVAAIRGLAHLSQLTGKEAEAKSLTEEFAKQQKQLNEAFWSPEKKFFAFALDRDNKRVDEPTVLTTVPMWFGLTDESKSQQTIAELSKPEHQADWGMRIISNHAAKYSGGGYHYGSVWPLFTGWASVGEYRYHRPLPAFENLRANALLALDGSLGHVTEVLSGDSYQPLSTSSPHQIWSAAMVVSPIQRGMLGLSSDAKTATLTFAPHVPADWSTFSVHGARAGSAHMDLTYARSAEAITLQINCTSATACPIEFSPSVSARAQVLGVELNGRPVAFRVVANSEDQHVTTRVSASGKSNTLTIRVRNDFGVSYESTLPPLGSHSQGLRMLSESWTANRDTFTMDVAGVAGGVYELTAWNPSQAATVEGGELLGTANGSAKVRVRFPASESGAYAYGKIVFHFSGARDRRSKPKIPGE